MNKINTYTPVGKGYLVIVASLFFATVKWVVKQHLFCANIFVRLSRVAEFIKADHVTDRLQGFCERVLNKRDVVKG